MRAERPSARASASTLSKNGRWLSKAMIRPPEIRARTRVCFPGPQPMSRIIGFSGTPFIIRKAFSVEASSPGPARGRAP